jgi:hypothetical protein
MRYMRDMVWCMREEGLIWYTAYNIQHTAYSIQHTEVWYMV